MEVGHKFFQVGRIVKGIFNPCHYLDSNKLIMEKTIEDAELIVQTMVENFHNSHDLAIVRVTVESITPKFKK